MNTMITLFVLIVSMAVALIVTLPDSPVVALVIGLGVVAAVLPVVIYPFTYTIWLALELSVHPPDKAELAEAALAVKRDRVDRID